MDRQTEFTSKKTAAAIEKAEKAILELSEKNIDINFNSVAVRSGVSSSFLYRNESMRQKIEQLRSRNRKKYAIQPPVISKSVKVKEQRVKDLENENKMLKKQIEDLKKKLYILYM